MDPFTAIAAQRRAVADVFDGLTPEQWRVQSLCTAWSIHQLLGHLLVPFEASKSRVVIEMVKARGKFARANEELALRVAAAPTAELIAGLRAHADSHFTPPGHDWHAPLTDIYVHTQDACIPLGLTPPADPGQWPSILDFLHTKKARSGFVGRPLPAVRFTATDVDWATGEGPEVTGPAAAMATVVLGRTALVSALDGPGAPVLAGWAAGS